MKNILIILFATTLAVSAFGQTNNNVKNSSESKQDSLTEISSIGIFDGVFIGKTGYKINDYYIRLGDITSAQIDSLKGKKIIVTGKLKNRKGNRGIQSKAEDTMHIFEPQFAIYYETREPLIKK